MLHAYMGELLGTLILVLLGNGVVANVVLPKTKGNNSGWIVVTFGWAMAVFVAVWCVRPLSGAHINPAVSVGLATAGKFAWSQVAGYVAAQMLGAVCGAFVVYLLYRDHYVASQNAADKLATFATAPAIPNAFRNLLSEIIGTSILVLAVLLVAEPSIEAFEHPPASAQLPNVKIGLGTLGALPVGLLVFSIGLSLGGTTGYAINPARDLGPRMIHWLLPVPGKGGSDWSYAWIPVVGPLLGSLLAAAIFALLSAGPQ